MDELLKYDDENYESSGEDFSDGGLAIVEDSPRVKKRSSRSMEIRPEEKEVISALEDTMEKALDEKAAKFNCTSLNVKNLIKNVITNEHVVAMVKQVENPESKLEIQVFEPKLTRAKAKELSKDQPIPWISPKLPPSEVQALMTEELHESDEDDEYIPEREESEDDRDTSIASELDTYSMPASQESQIRMENDMTDDGLFKIPQTATVEDTNIALRTRSKLSLSHTPLEVIEQAFMPPDITTDMYDMNCGDHDWADFLKTFTKPLDEVLKEDDDHDPEYNVLADMQENEEDKEELRADKAVKITKKEMVSLWSELADFADDFLRHPNKENLASIDPNECTTPPPLQLENMWKPTPEKTYHTLENVNLNEGVNNANAQTENSNTYIINVVNSADITYSVNTINLNSIPQQINIDVSDSVTGNFEQATTEPICYEIIYMPDGMSVEQKYLFEQQMRQHVQMLTQTFLLGYCTEFKRSAEQCETCLNDIKDLALPNIVNLKPAMELVNEWKDKVNSNDEEVQEMKEQYKEYCDKMERRKKIYTFYKMQFPDLLFDTLADSRACIYPELLPDIPSIPKRLQLKVHTRSEALVNLLTIAIEQFTEYLENLPDNTEVEFLSKWPKYKKTSLEILTCYIQKYVFPMNSTNEIYKTIQYYKKMKKENPIKAYFKTKQIPKLIHYVYPLKDYGVIAPRYRNPEQLSETWRGLLHPELFKPKKGGLVKEVYNRRPTKNPVLIASKPKRSTPRKPPIWEKKSPKKTRPKYHAKVLQFPVYHTGKKLQEHFQCSDSNIRLTRSFSELRFNSNIFSKIREVRKREITTNNRDSPDTTVAETMLPNLFQDNSKVSDVSTSSIKNDEDGDEKMNEVSTTNIDLDEEESGKDNIEDINALMVASSTIKNNPKRTPSGSEKKRLRLRKEFISHITLLSPEDPTVVQEKANSYVQAFYDKVQEKLEVQEYHEFMQVLNNFDYRISSTDELYEQVCKILLPKHQDIADEFLTFLTPSEAKTVGKSKPHFMYRKMSLFLHKLGIYFKDQPSQLRKVYRSLTELASCVDASMDLVKGNILPLLKGNTLLTDWFLQIFPDERPPDSLVNGPWESIDVSCEPYYNGDEVYETVVIPDFEDQYGGLHCICNCHNSEEIAFKQRHQHCMPCGKKFLQGRVYIQTGKGLRLAHVTFDSNQEEHVKRLCGSTPNSCKKRSDHSPTKQTSPLKDKDSQEENIDTDDEVMDSRKKAKARTPRKRKLKISGKTEKVVKRSKLNSLKSPVKNQEEKSVDSTDVGQDLNVSHDSEPECEAHESSGEIEGTEADVDSSGEVEDIDSGGEGENMNGNRADNSHSSLETKGDDVKEEVIEQSTDVNQEDNHIESTNEPKIEDMKEWDCNTSIESIKLTPDNSGESESETCEESSQDNLNSDCDDSEDDAMSLTQSPTPHSENSNSNMFEEVTWTRDEDRIILLTIREMGNSDEAITHIYEQLDNKSIEQIKTRFQHLLALLQEMAAASQAE